MNSVRCLLLFCLLIANVTAQVTRGEAGYRTPSKLISAAPGQIVVLTFDGVAARTPNPASNFATNGYPTRINGLSMTVTGASGGAPDVVVVAVWQNAAPDALTRPHLLE